MWSVGQLTHQRFGRTTIPRPEKQATVGLSVETNRAGVLTFLHEVIRRNQCPQNKDNKRSETKSVPWSLAEFLISQ